MEATLLLLLAAVLAFTGLAGLLFPVLPGAPLLFAGLVVAAWAENFEFIGLGTIIVLAVLSLMTYAVDVAAGILGARRFGASPRAMIGAGVGAVAGLFFGLPGVLLGPFLGACLGEMTAVNDLRMAGRAGFGATVGLVVGAALKIAIAFTMLGIYAFMRFG